jgi:hypothetical protein
MASEAAIQNLLSSTTRSLRRVCAHWLTPVELRRRTEVQILLYLERLRDPRARAEVLARVTPPARTLLSYAIALEQGGEAGQILVTAAAAGYPVTLAALGELHYYGLAFLENPALWPKRNEVWTWNHASQSILVPAALHDDALQLPEPEVSVPPVTAAITALEPSRLPAANVLLTTFLQHVSNGAVRLTQQGKLSMRSRRALDETWPDDEPNELYAPLHMLAFAFSEGIAKKTSTGLVVPGPGFAVFRQQTRAAQTRDYLDYSTAHAYDSADTTTRYGFSPRQCALAMIRTILGNAPDDDWLPVTGIIRAIVATVQHVFSAQPGIPNWTWDVSCYPFPQRRTWHALVTGLIENWYHSSGVIECGTKGDDSLCVRLTSLGRFWLTGQGAPVHENQYQQLVVQPDFTVVLTHSGPWDRTAQVLSLFATRSGDDNASIFRFARDTVRTAVKQGHAIQELLELLDTASSYPVPPNVRHTLLDWSISSSEVVLHRDTHVYTFEDTPARDEFITAFPELNVAPVGTCYALTRAPEGAVLDAMQRVHAVPVDYTHPPIGGIDIHADGEVVCTAPDDLRLVALRDALARPARPRKEAADDPPWYLSLKAMEAARAPQQVFERALKAQARPFSIDLKVLLMVGLGLVKRGADQRYALVEGLSASARAALKQHIPWRTSLVAGLTRDKYVMPIAYAVELEQVAEAAGVELAVQYVDISQIPVKA